MTKEGFITLYEKHLNGTATREELDILLRYQDDFEMYIISEKDDAGSHAEVKRRIFDKLEDNIEQPTVRQIGKRAWWSVAAAIFLFTTTGLYFLKFNHKPSTATNNTMAAIGHNIKPGTNQATLTLANGKTLILTDSLNGELASQAGVKVSKTKQGEIIYTAAANGDNQATLYNTLTTKRSEQFQVILPDGSHVWLDAASSLKYPVVFKGDKRMVELTGQGYFEVSHNAAMPFIVKTARTEVQVLGTHFNVSAYEDDQIDKTTLLEGLVRIRNHNSTALLKPGEQALSDNKGNLTVNKADVDQEVAWKNGLFDFRKAGIEEIMVKASRWYDINVIYEGKVPDTRLIGKVSRNVDISSLLETLQFEGIKLRVEGKNVIVSN
ncbi:FecR family protein [Mucilaginibacter sp. UC70_90]